ncbi:hypothetical protein PLICRDRAFT_129563 [Plicaturopsis crispa FD-325 SS-3]|nr:hypothetical protein PLICRDRAFT_129563 [Plicaturopsis crispa FD-325 SS-3]
MRPPVRFLSSSLPAHASSSGARFRPTFLRGTQPTADNALVLRSRTGSTRLFTQGERERSQEPLGDELEPREQSTRLHTQREPPGQRERSSSSSGAPFNFGGPSGGAGGGGSIFPLTSSPLIDAALTTIVGLGLVFVGGIAYLSWYKKNVLDKIEGAFAKGYDPALELANHGTAKREKEDSLDDLEIDEDGPWTEHLRRREQEWVDRIIHGAETGHYFILLGPKGAGKGTMMFDAMQANQAEGVAMCDAHPDLEVFRLRLGKALNYEYNEDSQTGLFQRRDPREGGPALDIERALNKLEKVALRSAKRTGRPLVLVINNVHFFNNDDAGKNILLQLQQRAEAWAASGILTFVFSTDDSWPFFFMRKTASRMHVLSIYDLDTKEALHASTRIRMNARKRVEDPEALKKAISIVGGRLAYLNKVAKSRDTVEMAMHLLSVEKAWLLSQIGLIPDCDDDVMDEQKWSSCSWLLLREFVKIRQEQERNPDSNGKGLELPSIPYWKCRQIMTRADFLEELDKANIVSIDIHHDVRPDSMLILHAARQVVEEEGFDETLDDVRERVDEIESLHRTRELTFKDLDKGDQIQLKVDKGGAVRKDS